MYFARFLQNVQKHIIQREWVNVNFSGEKAEPFVLVMKISTTLEEYQNDTRRDMDRQWNNKCLELWIKSWWNDFLQATTDVS